MVTFSFSNSSPVKDLVAFADDRSAFSCSEYRMVWTRSPSVQLVRFSNHLQESERPDNWPWQVPKTFVRRFDPGPRLQLPQRPHPAHLLHFMQGIPGS